MDLTGEVYGRLTALRLYCGGYSTTTLWECKCECGNICNVAAHKLRSGHTQSCGCLKGRAYIDLVGMKFNRLTVVKLYSSEGHLRWTCVCDCGIYKNVLGYNLKNGAVKSCGCLSKESHNKKHGLKRTRLYAIWDNMKSRCYRKNNPSYKHYGGRGIRICTEWKTDFQVFYDWAMSNGYHDNLSIERDKVNEDYSPSNCRWATTEEQAQNKTTSIGREKVLEIRELLKSKTMTQKQIAIIYKVNVDSIMKINNRITYKNI